MARVLVLSFSNNDAAERVVRLLDQIQGKEYIRSNEFGELGVVLASTVNIEALVARPTAWCRHRFVRGQPWKKTEKFGWYIHDVEGCKRPAAAVVKDFMKNMLIASGNNLLQELRVSWQTKEEDALDLENTNPATSEVLHPQETTQATETETQGDVDEETNNTG